MYEELNRVVEAALNQDEAAVVQLLDMVEPLIKSMINRLFPYTKEYEDLFSEAQLVLLECLQDFDPEREVYFIGYFQAHLRFYLLDRIKANTDADLPILDQPNAEGDCMLELLADEVDIEAILLAEESQRQLSQCIQRLSQREYEVIRLFYYYDLGLSEISGFLGLSYQTVANTKSRALKKLKDYYLEILGKEKKYVH